MLVHLVGRWVMVGHSRYFFPRSVVTRRPRNGTYLYPRGWERRASNPVYVLFCLPAVRACYSLFSLNTPGGMFQYSRHPMTRSGEGAHTLSVVLNTANRVPEGLGFDSPNIDSRLLVLVGYLRQNAVAEAFTPTKIIRMAIRPFSHTPYPPGSVVWRQETIGPGAEGDVERGFFWGVGGSCCFLC